VTFYNELEADFVEPDDGHQFQPDEDGYCFECGEPATRNHHGWMS
jgi:hypothetical protein